MYSMFTTRNVLKTIVLSATFSNAVKNMQELVECKLLVGVECISPFQKKDVLEIDTVTVENHTIKKFIQIQN